MKNRFLKLFMITTLTACMLVGCGGTETGVDNGVGANKETNVNSEVDNTTDDISTQFEYGVSNPDATYNETEYCYIVSDASFVEEKYNDGTEFDPTGWTPVNEPIKLNQPISIYNPFKDIMGYMKTDVTVVYVSMDGEWSYLGFAEEVAKDGLYPNGGTYVRTDELKAVMEVIDGNNSSAIGEEDTDSVETEVTTEELYTFVKSVCDEAGFVYDEGAFADVNLEDVKNGKTPTVTLEDIENGKISTEYSFKTYNFPIDNKDVIMSDLIQIFKDILANRKSVGYSGINYIIESVEIREPYYGEGSSKQCEFNLYLKIY